MAKLHQELFRFRRSEPDEVEQRVRRLVAAGTGWLNLQPMVDETAFDEGVFGLQRVLSSRGPRIPLGTFVPGAAGRRPSPASLGLEHPAGPKALERLAELGVERPSGWVRKQDHAKRGIVLERAVGADPAAVDATIVVRWLLDAGTALAGVPVGEWWVASIHLPPGP
jgi:hypothetical protein